MSDLEGVLGYYGSGIELGRLTRAEGLIEAARTKELILRYVPKGSTVLDVGGGVGFYADWLAHEGHVVRLIDPVPEHVEEARGAAGPEERFAVELGDARSLPAEDGSVDVVLLLGPLYHLVERGDRVQALREARRVVREGGLVFAAAISRYAPALDGMCKGWIAKAESVSAVAETTGSGAGYFGTPELGHAPAYFHLPEELLEESVEAGLAIEGLFGIEGPGWMLSDFDDKWADPVMRERLLWLAELVEADPRMLAASAHLLLVARKTFAD